MTDQGGESLEWTGPTLLAALARERVAVFSVDLESLKQEIERG